jgi:FKBP-type peptidyl-prolyl cis-trans isomerase 2
MIKLSKGDFVEIEFTGREKETGTIFDSNIQEDIEKSEMPDKAKQIAKSFIFSLGHGMFLSGVDDYLISNDIEENKEIEIELSPEKAFGKRNPKKIQMVPMKVFRENNLRPVQGAMFNFDGQLAKVVSVSSGRVLADFNNPLAGKDVIYKVIIKRKITNDEDKAKALNDFLFRKQFDFELKNKKVILKVPEQVKRFAEIFKDKYKEISGLDLEVQVEESKKSENKNNSKKD